MEILTEHQSKKRKQEPVEQEEDSEVMVRGWFVKGQQKVIELLVIMPPLLVKCVERKKSADKTTGRCDISIKRRGEEFHLF